MIAVAHQRHRPQCTVYSTAMIPRSEMIRPQMISDVDRKWTRRKTRNIMELLLIFIYLFTNLLYLFIYFFKIQRYLK